jgi:hypothetical protein
MTQVPSRIESLMADQARVRVWDMQGASIFAEGVVVAYSGTPMLCVRADNGTKSWWGVELPLDVADVQWRQV